MKKYIVISGVPGTGKSSAIEKIREARPELLFSRSCTDRARRPEEDEKAYEFLTAAQIEEGIREGVFLETVYSAGVHYATRKSTLDISDGDRLLLDLDTGGGAAVLKAYPEDALLIFIYATKEVVEQRLRRREEGRMPEAIIQERLGRWDTETERARAIYHWHVENEVLETCVEEILNIIDEN